MILEESGMTLEDMVQPNVIVMQYSFGRAEGSQVPQLFQEVTGEFRYNILCGQFRYNILCGQFRYNIPCGQFRYDIPCGQFRYNILCGQFTWF